jgi:hypothetical protein
MMVPALIDFNNSVMRELVAALPLFTQPGNG